MEASLQLLLVQKLEFLRTLAAVGMTWWASSVVFCTSMLGAVWLKEKEISETLFRWLRPSLTWFFGTIVAFGLLMAVMVCMLQVETLAISGQLNGLENGTFSEFYAVLFGYVIGTSSFVFVIVAWRVLCKNLALRYDQAAGRTPAVVGSSTSGE